jgi:hypothetical protein
VTTIQDLKYGRDYQGNAQSGCSLRDAVGLSNTYNLGNIPSNPNYTPGCTTAPSAPWDGNDSIDFSALGLNPTITVDYHLGEIDFSAGNGPTVHRTVQVNPGGIGLPSKVTINGAYTTSAGDVMSGTNTRIFAVAGDFTLIFSNMHLQYGQESGATSGAGGAVWIHGGSGTDVTFDEVQFNFNVALSAGGGAVRNDSSRHVTFWGCTFLQNRAPYGAAIDTGDSEVNIGYSIFDSNAAQYGGAAISIESATGSQVVSVDGVTVFKNNTVAPNLVVLNIVQPQVNELEGGAIRNFGNFTCTHCQFSNNVATTIEPNAYPGFPDYPGYGGAIFNGSNATLTIRESAFQKNWAGVKGGAIYSRGTSFIVQSSFYQDAAYYIFNGGGSGGAIAFEGSQGNKQVVANSTIAEGSTYNLNGDGSMGQGADLFIAKDANAVQLINNTIVYGTGAGNSNFGGEGIVYVEAGAPSPNPDLVFYNNIVANIGGGITPPPYPCGGDNTRINLNYGNFNMRINNLQYNAKNTNTSTWPMLCAASNRMLVANPMLPATPVDGGYQPPNNPQLTVIREKVYVTPANSPARYQPNYSPFSQKSLTGGNSTVCSDLNFYVNGYDQVKALRNNTIDIQGTTIPVCTMGAIEDQNRSYQ